MSGGRQWVAGGELGSTDKSAQQLKKIILDILEEGETVTKCGVRALDCHFTGFRHKDIVELHPTGPSNG